MRILFVINSFYGRGNGLAASARETVQHLRQAGMEVRIISIPGTQPSDPQPDYILRKLNFPLFQKLIESQSYCYAIADRKVLRQALEWADVIHIEETFILQWKAVNMARKMGKPCVCTYHMHPENICYTLGLGKCRLLNAAILKVFQKLVYDKCSHIQCPTLGVMDRLRKFHFKPEYHLISNGIKIPDEEVTPAQPQTKPYLITCIGRFSNEKDQHTLLKAMRYSRHSKEIQLYFAGQGPTKKRIQKKAERLFRDGVIELRPQFSFHTPAELRELAHRSYLNIHCAIVEVEGLSCLEAIREGAVPLIAQGRLTATSQFALDERSTFPVGNPRELAGRIDWWIEHPEERMAMSAKYIESARKYDIRNSINALIQMYRKAINENPHHAHH